MTRADVTALSGDPMATMDEAEWAEDMVAQLAKMSDLQRLLTIRDMTQEEADMVNAAYNDRIAS